MLRGNKGFTFVELIVVTVVLAILSTIGFSSYTSYLVGVRDTNRVEQLRAIGESLTLRSAFSKLPIPDSYITIKDGSEIVAYQGYVSKDIINTIGYTGEGVDPDDGSYFSYYLDSSKKNFQLMAFLEEQGSSSAFFSNQANASIDYENRFPHVDGSMLGIMTGDGSDLNKPLQEIDSVKSSGELNIATTPDSFVAYLDNDIKITGNSSKLKALSGVKKAGGIASSCKSLLDKRLSLKGRDGIYLINPNGIDPFSVYCDMTTDGGGWTILAKTGNESSSTKSGECGTTISITNLNIESSDYLMHCDLGQTEFLVNQPGDGWVIGTSGGNGEPNPDCTIEATKTGLNKCSWSGQYETFTIKKMSDSINSLNLACNGCGNRRIWRVGNNNNRDNEHIYDIRNGSNYGIGNRNGNSRSPTRTASPGNPLGYIGVR